MSVELVLLPEVEEDVADAFLWYEAQRVGLGEEFTAREPGKWRRRLL